MVAGERVLRTEGVASARPCGWVSVRPARKPRREVRSGSNSDGEKPSDAEYFEGRADETCGWADVGHEREREELRLISRPN